MDNNTLILSETQSLIRFTWLFPQCFFMADLFEAGTNESHKILTLELYFNKSR